MRLPSNELISIHQIFTFFCNSSSKYFSHLFPPIVPIEIQILTKKITLKTHDQVVWSKNITYVYVGPSQYVITTTNCCENLKEFISGVFEKIKFKVSAITIYGNWLKHWIYISRKLYPSNIVPRAKKKGKEKKKEALGDENDTWELVKFFTASFSQ